MNNSPHQQVMTWYLQKGQHSQCLFRLVVIWIEPIGRKLFDVSLRQSTEFGLPQTLSEVQEGLWGKKHQQQQKNQIPYPANIQTKE